MGVRGARSVGRSVHVNPRGKPSSTSEIEAWSKIGNTQPPSPGASLCERAPLVEETQSRSSTKASLDSKPSANASLPSPRQGGWAQGQPRGLLRKPRRYQRKDTKSMRWLSLEKNRNMPSLTPRNPQPEPPSEIASTKQVPPKALHSSRGLQPSEGSSSH